MKTVLPASQPLLVLIYLALLTPVSGQIIVNEYSVSNLSTITDNHGKYEDWIELYNTGDETIDLGGYYLSDKPDNPTKWQFPEGIMMDPGDFRKIWICLSSWSPTYGTYPSRIPAG